MASDRAKLSLRRHKKQTGASQPEVNAALPSSHGASTTESAPPPPVILTAENVGGGSDDAVECDSVHRVVRDVRRESEEFRPVQPQFRAGRAGLGRKRKRTQNGSERYTYTEKFILVVATLLPHLPHITSSSSPPCSYLHIFYPYLSLSLPSPPLPPLSSLPGIGTP